MTRFVKQLDVVADGQNRIKSATLWCQLFSLLDSAHDSWPTVICAFDDTGQNSTDSCVLWLLKSPHYSLLHYTDKLFVAQFSIAVVVKEGEDLSVKIKSLL